MKCNIGQYVRLRSDNYNKYPSDKWILIIGKNYDTYVALDDNGFVTEERHIKNWNIDTKYLGYKISNKIIESYHIVEVKKEKCLKCNNK